MVKEYSALQLDPFAIAAFVDESLFLWGTSMFQIYCELRLTWSLKEGP